jgi:hypothetical protein
MDNVQVYKNRRSSSVWTALIFLLIAAPLLLICGVATVSAALALNLVGDVEVLSASYAEPINGAESVELEIAPGVAQLNLQAVSGLDNLFEADVNYRGEIAYDVDDDAEREITLRNRSNSGLDGMLNFFDLFNVGEDLSTDDFQWDVDLNPGVPYDMRINGGVGELNLDLAALELTELRIEIGVGSVDLTLPEPVESYEVRVDGGVGRTVLNLPEGVPIRLEAETGVGDLSIPGGFERISGSGDSVVGDEGVWETEGFDEGTPHIEIEYTGGVGDLTIRR